jgi:CRISPR-associated endonuclease Csn1
MEAKLVLGLDLGVSSIGWALINVKKDVPEQIIDLGSRIVPLTADDKNEFSSGNAISKNQKRTQKRTQRKGYKRYQLRRFTLSTALTAKGMMPFTELINISSVALYGLRDKALKEKLTLQEIGRVLYHINQKRGYKSARSEANKDNKETEYVANILSRYETLKQVGQTIGQHFYKQLSQNQYFRVKDNIFPREAYIAEFDAVCKFQQQFYKDILTDDFIDNLKNDIIFFQRKLKSQKGLVSRCEFEGKVISNENGKEKFVGPRVAARTNPLFQLCKVWENVNNLTLKVKNEEGAKYKWSDLVLSIEQKQRIATWLFTNEKLTFNDLLKLLQLKKEDVFANKQIQAGIKGNEPFAEINKIVSNKALLAFDIAIDTLNDPAYLTDKKTGEVINELPQQVVNANFEQLPFYQLWHIIYSISDIEECKQALIKRFNIPETEASALAKLDFAKKGFGEKSNKAMRKILPYLMQGIGYAYASEFAGYNHGNTLTADKAAERIVADQLNLLDKNSLRQPVVEKILNQMINLVNTLIKKYGKPDEIRVELSRELKQSKDERNETTKNNTTNKKINEEIEKRLKDLGVPITKKNIQKYKFIFPTKNGKWAEAQAITECIYCGQNFNLASALNGEEFDVDHIVPKALLFDDSQTNKVLVHRRCNANKTNTTAYDYITAQGDVALEAYLNRVEDWFKKGAISYTKMQRLKVSYNDYLERKKAKKETEADKRLWENFIERQLRETAYISKKARELLLKICRYVHSTEGTVTAKLRRLWGWEDILEQLQFGRFKDAEQTIQKTWTSQHGKHEHQKEIINPEQWTKRDDHRHHAIDALVVACTKQGYIQRLNTLHAAEVRDAMKKEIKAAGKLFDEKMNLIDTHFLNERPFTTQQVTDAVAQILISFKAGKKVATLSNRKATEGGKRKIVQTGIITPRGALSEESVYGKINTIEKQKSVKFIFENPHLILKTKIKKLVEERLEQFASDTKKALASLKKEPIYLDADKTIVLEYATCYKEEVVIKYPLLSLKAKDAEYIIDSKVKALVKERLAQHGNNEKRAFAETLWFNEALQIPIHTVRCFTNLTAVEAVKKDEEGKEIGFVKPGNNHHLAIYKDAEGKLIEHVCTFWHAVERKKYKIPVIISDTKSIWNNILADKSAYPQSFLDKLPPDNCELFTSMQQNEMFILGLDAKKIEQLDKKTLSAHVYRVQKIGSTDYTFRHHLETKITDDSSALSLKRYYRLQSINAFLKLDPVKIKIDTIGELKF